MALNGEMLKAGAATPLAAPPAPSLGAVRLGKRGCLSSSSLGADEIGGQTTLFFCYKASYAPRFR